MTPSALRQFCNSLPGASEQIQWENDRVYKIGGKMFACSGLEKNSKYSFKVDDHRLLELTDLDGVFPAPYLARSKWVQIDPAACGIPSREVQEFAGRSYAIVLSKLTKKAQRAIQDGQS